MASLWNRSAGIVNYESWPLRSAEQGNQKRLQLCFRLRLTFPNRENAPAGGFERRPVLFVARYVPSALFAPEFSPRFWNDAAPPAVVTVPEAAVHEDDGAVFRENNIRLSRQVFSVKAVSVSKGVKDRADPHFRLGIPALYRSHVPAALFRAVNIGHDQATPERPSRSLTIAVKSARVSSVCRCAGVKVSCSPRGITSCSLCSRIWSVW